MSKTQRLKDSTAQRTKRSKADPNKLGNTLRPLFVAALTGVIADGKYFALESLCGAIMHNAHQTHGLLLEP